MKIGTLLQRIGRWITFLRNFAINTLFILILVGIVIALMRQSDTMDVPNGAALLLNPSGALVEQKVVRSPFSDFGRASDRPAESSLPELLRAIDAAAEDARFKMIALDLDGLDGVSPAHARTIGTALRAFQDAGKPVIAYADSFSQGRYALASYADSIYLHPEGDLIFSGYGVYPAHFKSLLDKLGVKVHVFRVGAYKSAVEPFIGDAMSPESREAYQLLVDALWESYRQLIVANRDISIADFDRFTAAYDQVLVDADGQFGEAALAFGLVDELLSREALRDRLAETVGTDETSGFRRMPYRQYLSTLMPEPAPEKQVAVVVAQGVIIPGSDHESAATDDLTALIRRARRDDSVAALVLRIDSPGGSAFAAELIRQQLVSFQEETGKPIVASMGPVAASGGYWIAASADRIIAHPTTLTGSIGIFGLVPTLEEGMGRIGVHTDGVGSLPISSALDPFQALNAPVARIMQSSIEHGYRSFINLVAEGRNMSPEQVESVAQGRVWLGNQAKALMLVDELGDLDHAVAVAADLAGIADSDYGVQRFTTPVDRTTELIAELMDSVGFTPPSLLNAPAVRQLKEAAESMALLQDPKHRYVLCDTCVSLK